MARFLYDGVRKVEAFIWYEGNSSREFIKFEDEFFTVNFLRKFTHNSLNILTLRAILAEFIPVTPMLTDDEVIEQSARRIVRGHIRLAVFKEPEYGWGGGSRGTGEEAADSETSGQAAAETAATETGRQAAASAASTASEQSPRNWIEFRVVDDETGQPVSGLKLKIKLPTGQTSDYTTNASGTVRIDNLPSGTCDMEKILDTEAFEVVRVE